MDGISYDASYVGGMLILSVNTGGPAYVAGLRANDIIIKVDDLTVVRPEDLMIYLERYKSPGDVISLKVVRGNDFSNPIDIALTLGVRP